MRRFWAAVLAVLLCSCASSKVQPEPEIPVGEDFIAMCETEYVLLQVTRNELFKHQDAIGKLRATLNVMKNWYQDNTAALARIEPQLQRLDGMYEVYRNTSNHVIGWQWSYDQLKEQGPEAIKSNWSMLLENLELTWGEVKVWEETLATYFIVKEATEAILSDYPL
jgi:hypothetical protein